MDGYDIDKALRHDFSADTEEFREALLEQCLAQLGADDEARELGEDELEMLAAAGVPSMESQRKRPGM